MFLQSGYRDTNTVLWSLLQLWSGGGKWGDINAGIAEVCWVLHNGTELDWRENLEFYRWRFLHLSLSVVGKVDTGDFTG